VTTLLDSVAYPAEAIAALYLERWSVDVLLWYRQKKFRCVVTDAMRTAGSALGRAGLQRILAILKNPVYAGAFAYGRTSTRSRTIEGRSGKTAGNGVPMEPWVGTISFWYSTG
jgi:hypothetical protein